MIIRTLIDLFISRHEILSNNFNLLSIEGNIYIYKITILIKVEKLTQIQSKINPLLNKMLNIETNYTNSPYTY